MFYLKGILNTMVVEKESKKITEYKRIRIIHQRDKTLLYEGDYDKIDPLFVDKNWMVTNFKLSDETKFLSMPIIEVI